MTPIPAAILVLGQAVSLPAVVKVTPPPPLTLKPGASVEARVSVTVKKGFHVQANPASEPYLIPLRLEIESSSPLLAAKPIYPRGNPYRLAGAESDLSTYDGSFEIRLPLESPAGAAPGEVTVKGKLHYQACDDRVCLSPTSVPVSILVRVINPR